MISLLLCFFYLKYLSKVFLSVTSPTLKSPSHPTLIGLSLNAFRHHYTRSVVHTFSQLQPQITNETVRTRSNAVGTKCGVYQLVCCVCNRLISITSCFAFDGENRLLAGSLSWSACYSAVEPPFARGEGMIQLFTFSARFPHPLENGEVHVTAY